jgi:hypothetical protein
LLVIFIGVTCCIFPPFGNGHCHWSLSLSLLVALTEH